MKKVLILLMALSSSAMAATNEVGSSDYSTAEARNAQTVQTGKVIKMRTVTLHKVAENNIQNRLNIGSAVGGLLGTVLASSTNNYAISTVGAVAGAAVGTVVQEQIEGSTESATGFEIIVKLDKGSVISVTQGSEGVDFMEGDTVYLTGTSTLRVFKL